jgi:carbonic anhydrase
MGSISVVLLSMAFFVCCAAGRKTDDTWDYLRQDYWGGECITGRRQSPIDFRNASAEHVRGNYELRFRGDCELGSKTKGGMVPERHAFVVADPKLNCEVEDPVSGKRYKVKELHFHMTSEHVLPDGPGDFEVHILTEAPSGRLVVSTLFRSGQDGPPATAAALFDILKLRDAAPGQTYLADLLPGTGGPFYYYDGSLTTPPCTQQDVHWIVMATPVQVPSRVVAELRNNMIESAGAPFTNNRDTQRIGRLHNVRLINSGGYGVTWELYSSEHLVRKIVLVLAGLLVVGAIVMLLYFNRETTESTYEAIPEPPKMGSYKDPADLSAISVNSTSGPEDVAASAGTTPSNTPNVKPRKGKHVSYGTL